ncbi:MAG: class I adenylate-forming enzyme family protein [bacterium]|nr:class I adenylate-forming enzyme family protein [bacterium]
MNLFSEFEKAVPTNATRILAKDFQGESSFQEVYKQSIAMAATLCAKYESESHIGFMLPNIKEVFPVAFGIWRANMVATPINYLLSPKEMLTILKHGEVRCLITRKEWGEPLIAAASQMGLNLDVIYVDDMESERSLLLALKSADPSKLTDLIIDEDRLAMLLYTSGTTGNPKGVMLSHRNLLHNVRGGIDRIAVQSGEVMLGVLPYFHTFALTVNLLIPAIQGLTVSLMVRFTPKEFFELVQRDKINIITLIPSMYKVLLRSKLGPEVFSAARIFVSGGEALTRSVGEKFYSKFNHVICEGYGLTETAPIIAVNPMRGDTSKLGTVGTPTGQTEVYILDDSGTPIQGQNIGQIAVKSPSVMLGYFKNDEATQQLWKGEYFCTGDLGYLDKDGFLVITGREKDLIISAGENIYPSEIEEVVQTYQGVQECAVVGLPCKVRGETVVLAVSPEMDEKDLKSYLKERLPQYKQPKQIIFLEELPKNPLGKIMKREIVNQLESSKS